VPLLSKLSGLSKLIDAFETDQFPSDAEILKTSVQIGGVRFRKCAAIQLNKKGIYLRITMIFKHYPPVFIPREAIKGTTKLKLYGRKAVQFDFVDSTLPALKVYEKDYQQSTASMTE